MLRYYEKKADAIIEEIKCIKFYNKNASSYKILIMYVFFLFYLFFILNVKWGKFYTKTK